MGNPATQERDLVQALTGGLQEMSPDEYEQLVGQTAATARANEEVLGYCLLRFKAQKLWRETHRSFNAWLADTHRELTPSQARNCIAKARLRDFSIKNLPQQQQSQVLGKLSTVPATLVPLLVRTVTDGGVGRLGPDHAEAVAEQIEAVSALSFSDGTRHLEETIRRKRLAAVAARAPVEGDFAPTVYFQPHGEMTEVEDESVDLVFADPPYGLSNGGITCRSGKQVSVNKGSWDHPDALDFTWIATCHRKLKPTGSIYVTGTYHSVHEVAVELKRIGFKLVNDIAWVKRSVNPQLTPNRFSSAHETILFAVKGRSYFFDYEGLKAGNGGKQLRDVWEIERLSERERLGHPTQKPEALLTRIVSASCPEGGLVLDPFLGSGTTAAVCQRLRRHSVGYEADPTYEPIIRARIFGGFQL